MQKKNKDMQIRRSYNVNASLGRTSYALDVFTKEKKKKKKGFNWIKSCKMNIFT